MISTKNQTISIFNNKESNSRSENMAKKKYTVIVEKDENGWLIADVPELEGCHTQAKNMDVLIKRVKEVIELCEENSNTKTQFVGIQLIEA